MVLRSDSDANELHEIVFLLGYSYRKMPRKHSGEHFIGRIQVLSSRAFLKISLLADFCQRIPFHRPFGNKLKKCYEKKANFRIFSLIFDSFRL